MNAVFRYRGRTLNEHDIEAIRELIASRPRASRRALSEELCRRWQWGQSNGALCAMVCRGLMLALHRQGLIELPPPRRMPANPLAKRRSPTPVAIDQSPLRGTLGEIGAIELEQVRRTDKEALFNHLVAEHHYLGYTQPVGEHLKYIARAGGRPIACFAWSSAPRHLGPRDRYIGWSPAQRRRCIHLVTYNPRFLILPWVFVPHLASHLLGQMVRRLAADWQRIYGHPVYFAETFVDPERFRGTCYRAANWIRLGQTTGRGKDDLTHRPNRPIKDVYGYPLHRRFRELMAEQGR